MQLMKGQGRRQITHHTGFATFVPIFHEICSTYSFTAVHLLKRIFGTNILEICIHISILCRCIHTKGYWMHTYTKYAPIYPPLRMYSYEVCLVQTYSKYAHTYTNCVLNRIIEHQVQMSLDIYCLFRIFYVPLHVSQVCPGQSPSHQHTCTYREGVCNHTGHSHGYYGQVVFCENMTI